MVQGKRTNLKCLETTTIMAHNFQGMDLKLGLLFQLLNLFFQLFSLFIFYYYFLKSQFWVWETVESLSLPSSDRGCKHVSLGLTTGSPFINVTGFGSLLGVVFGCYRLCLWGFIAFVFSRWGDLLLEAFVVSGLSLFSLGFFPFSVMVRFSSGMATWGWVWRTDSLWRRNLSPFWWKQASRSSG